MYVDPPIHILMMQQLTFSDLDVSMGEQNCAATGN
jgi:hypothetical protein